MSKKDKQRVDAAWRRDFVMGADGLEGPFRELAASSEAAERRSPRVVGADPPQGDGDPVVPRSRREAVADEVRGMALELIEECAQLSSLSVQLAAIDEASEEARTLARDALGAAAAARGMLFALLRHVEVVPREEGPWSMLVPPGRDRL